MGLSVEGAVVLLTGASAGIGAALAPRLAERGATVGLVGRRADRLEAVTDECNRHCPGSTWWSVDLGEPEAAEDLVDTAWDHFGHIDVLVNNAAVPKRRHVTELTVEELQATMRVNFETPARMTMKLLPRLVEKGRGCIVNVSSMGGRAGIPDETAYCASKFALAGWSEALAIDLWDSPVDVRLIIPGPIDTDIWDRPDNDRARYDGPLEPPGPVADGIIAAIEGDGFEHYLPDLKAVAEFKTGDIDAYLAGAASMGRDRSP